MGYGGDGGSGVVNVGVPRTEFDEFKDSVIYGKTGQKLQLIGGTIRNSGSGWEYIEDVDHAKTGLNTLELVDNAIQINYSFTGTKVGTLIVSPDETFASFGIITGASVAKGYALITLCAPFSCEVTPGGISSISGMFDPETTFELLADNAGFKITHLASFSGDQPILSIMDDGNNRLSMEVRAMSDLTTVTVRFFDYLSGLVTNNGSAVSVSSNNLIVPTATFSNGEFTILHTTIYQNDAVIIENNDSPYHYRVSTKATNLTRVKVYDMSGALVTALNSDMKFYFTRLVKVKSAMPATARIKIRRGPVLINPATFSNSNGNLWIYGFMEIA
jgi:hypothetical protein